MSALRARELLDFTVPVRTPSTAVGLFLGELEPVAEDEHLAKVLRKTPDRITDLEHAYVGIRKQIELVLVSPDPAACDRSGLAGGDCDEPGPEPVGLPEAAQSLPGRRHRLLKGVSRVAFVAQAHDEIAIEVGAASQDEPVERSGAPELRATNELGLVELAGGEASTLSSTAPRTAMYSIVDA